MKFWWVTRFKWNRLGLLLGMAGGLLPGQTQVDLKSQSRNVDFSGIANVRPVTVGSVLPATCAAGALFFKSDAPAGENLYGCVGGNTWSLQGGAAAHFSDLESSSTSSQYSIQSGRVRFTINGLPETIQLGPATISKIAGTDSGSFWVYADYNNGAPVLRCAYGTGLSIGNYTVAGFSGSTCVSGNGFPALSVPLAAVDVNLGILQAPFDFRSVMSQDALIAGAGLTLAGNVLSVSGAGASGGVERLTFASLPTCTLAKLNTEFVFTDGMGLNAHCNGTSFAYFYQGQAVVLPGTTSTFTKVNAVSGNDVTDARGGLYVHGATAVGNSLVTALKALGSATDIRVAAIPTGGGDANTCGLILAEGAAAGNKVTVFGERAESGSATTGVWNYATYSSAPATAASVARASGSVRWLRAVIDGGIHRFFVSVDGGNTWEQVAEQSAFATATHYGIGCDSGGTVTSVGMLVVSLSAQ